MESLTLLRKPIDYVKIIFRRKWLFVIPTFIGLIGGIAAINMLPKIYESATLMLVEEGRVINPLVEGLAVSTSVAQRLGVLREQMLGWDRINQLISKLDLAKDVKTQQEFEDLIARLRRSIKVKLYGQNIVRISYQGQDPREAMSIVKTITDIFIAENLKQQDSETENAIDFINDQLALYQKKVKQTEVAAMEDRLNNLLIDSTDKHPMVIDLKKKIEQAKAEVEQGNYNVDASVVAGSDSEFNELKKELKAMRKELTTSNLDAEKGGENRAKLATATNEKLYKLLLLERIDKVASEDAGINKKLYNELLQRLETAKITQRLEASKDGTRYIILDPARLPLRPVKPNKQAVLLIGMFLGMCGGVGLIFAVEVFDHSFLGVDEAKAYLDIPLLGGISKIVTQADVKAQRMHNIKVTSLFILASALLSVVIIYNVILGG